MIMQAFIEQFVEDLELGALFNWADIFGVPFDATGWPDDDYPDEADSLKAAVVEVMLKSHQSHQKESFDGTQTNPMPLGAK